jgi:uncharacterized protein YbgA (DUF1722 family)
MCYWILVTVNYFALRKDCGACTCFLDHAGNSFIVIVTGHIENDTNVSLLVSTGQNNTENSTIVEHLCIELHDETMCRYNQRMHMSIHTPAHTSTHTNTLTHTTTHIPQTHQPTQVLTNTLTHPPT